MVSESFVQWIDKDTFSVLNIQKICLMKIVPAQKPHLIFVDQYTIHHQEKIIMHSLETWDFPIVNGNSY